MTIGGTSIFLPISLTEASAQIFSAVEGRQSVGTIIEEKEHIMKSKVMEEDHSNNKSMG
jgi:hypothetical protein